MTEEAEKQEGQDRQERQDKQEWQEKQNGQDKEEMSAMIRGSNNTPSHSLRDMLGRYEGRLIRREIRRCGGNKTKTAKALGISRVGLYNIMARLGIRRGR
jgi:DNA-binding NtrC family response regulator